MIIKTIENKQFTAQSGQSILDTALHAGLVFDYSCKTGQCGICKTTLLQGDVKELQAQIALSEQDKVSNKILTCCCTPINDILIDVEDLSVLHGIEIKTLPARVSAIRKYTSEIIEVTIKLPPTADFKFLEGQYIDIIWNKLRRSYSIASTTKQKTITLLIKRFENGKMSDYWFNQAKEKDFLRIEGPKGSFFLREESNPLIFLATGTGIAPIMSILKQLDDSDDFKQNGSILIYWGNRYSDEFIWQPEFDKLKVELMRVCSKPGSDWAGGVGYVQDIALAQQPSLVHFDIYACGSNEMIQSAKQLFIEQGLPESQFYSDAFLQSY